MFGSRMDACLSLKSTQSDWRNWSQISPFLHSIWKQILILGQKLWSVHIDQVPTISIRFSSAFYQQNNGTHLGEFFGEGSMRITFQRSHNNNNKWRPYFLHFSHNNQAFDSISCPQIVLNEWNGICLIELWVWILKIKKMLEKWREPKEFECFVPTSSMFQSFASPKLFSFN
jgi:hypothetical protein